MGEKSEKRRKEIYTILGLLIGLCGLCGTWLAVPNIRSLIDQWFDKPAESTSVESNTENNGVTYTVTVLNDSLYYLRFDQTYEVESEQMTSFEVGTGLAKIPVEFSYNGQDWRLNASLEMNLTDNITYECKELSVIDTIVWSFREIFGTGKSNVGSAIKCTIRK